ncbi:MAG: DUF302 domain-containing protein [Flavobacteriales bacterium]|nr:DUF302 domain-containing protein [Flavobacteriales bacterium]MCB9447986.1 DUF302 domain-containing protein [Flavobacteriales bacterium]
MAYYFSKTLHTTFDEGIQRVRDALMAEGFGVLTDIDIQDTLHKKLDASLPKYRILGACHPPSALQAITAEDKIGVFLPCNVVVREQADGTVEVAAVDPVASMMAVKNDKLGSVAGEVQSKLKKVIDQL